MIKKILLVASLSISLFSQSASDFKKEQQQGFKNMNSGFSTYKKDIYKEFEIYQKEQNKAYKAYKKELGIYWEEPKLSSQKSWVSYTKDKKTQTDVDFENEMIHIKTIANSQSEARAKLQAALKKVVLVDTKTVQDTDPLEKRLKKIKKPSAMINSEVKAEPILTTVIFNKAPSSAKVNEYVNQNTKNIKSVKSNKVQHAMVYSVAVAMPKNAMLKRSKLYYKEVKKQAKIQKLPIPLIFAIMHSESSFNPRARSYIPAYGLMQIVPKSAGIDTYKYLYNKKKLVSGTYLYNSTNNITMGAGYLHILYYSYLKHIKNPDSRLYCTIAAYNTGSGNIAWAFTKTHNIKKAVPLINKLTPEQVYNKLLRDLRYDEPKHYLKKVSKRMSAYHKVYGL